MTGHIEPIVGRYIHVEIDGEMHRIYFEENGAGIPLLCLHTAGSDGRQWRHLLSCPLHLLTGECDFSCTPEDTMRTAAAIPGASFTIMEHLGHFPMSENPEQFRRYIAPVLGRILKQSTPTKQGVYV
jgi:hypothetical protein